jgi:hypothetical protein
MTDQSGGERIEDDPEKSKKHKNAKKRRHKRAKAQAEAERKKKEDDKNEEGPECYETQIEDLPVEKVEKQVTRMTGNLNDPQFVRELYNDNTLYN